MKKGKEEPGHKINRSLADTEVFTLALCSHFPRYTVVGDQSSGFGGGAGYAEFAIISQIRK
jgi:hypothetical protein